MSSILCNSLRACSQQIGSAHRGNLLCLSFHLLIAWVAMFVVNNSELTAQDKPKAESECKDLINPDDLIILRTSAQKFRKAMNKGNLSQADINVIKEFARIQVLQMSLEEKRKSLPDIRKTVKQNFLRPSQAATELLLAEITRQCKKLLNCPLPVRLNAVLLIGELNQTQANLAKRLPAVPYEGKTEVLLSVIKDPKQHQAVKIAAVNGLYRVCKDSSLKVSMRKKIGVAVVAELNNPKADPWYKRVCIATLGVVDDLYDARRKPYIIQTLCEILIDNQQPWLVRATAANALGRAKMDGQINLPLVNHEIARFTYDLAVQFNRKPRQYYWKSCVFLTYTAYRKRDLQDKALLDRIKSSLLGKYRTNVEETYKQILPIINAIYSSPKPLPKTKIPPVSKAKLQALKDFIEKNPPASLSVAPGAPPLRKPVAVDKDEK